MNHANNVENQAADMDLPDAPDDYHIESNLAPAKPQRMGTAIDGEFSQAVVRKGRS